MATALVQKGPLVASFRVASDFLSYRTGVYRSPKDCLSSGIKHSLLIIGYGTEDTDDYWLV